MITMIYSCFIATDHKKRPGYGPYGFGKVIVIHNTVYKLTIELTLVNHIFSIMSTIFK